MNLDTGTTLISKPLVGEHGHIMTEVKTKLGYKNYLVVFAARKRVECMMEMPSTLDSLADVQECDVASYG